MKIVKITAIWCSSCIIVNNILDELKAEYELNIDELDYDYDEDAKKYNPGTKLPVLIIYNKDNQEIKRIIGERSKKELISIFNDLKKEL